MWPTVTALAPPLSAGLNQSQVLGFVLIDISIILVVARLFGAVARRIGQPTVVGEIIAGIVLGPTLLGRTIFAWNHPWSFMHCGTALGSSVAPSITACVFPPQSQGVLSALGQIALVLYMFLVGLEVDPSLLKGKGKAIATLAFGAVAVPIGAAFAITPVLFKSQFVARYGTALAPSHTTFSLMVGAMLAVTAFPVMARILQEKHLTQSPMASVGVAAAAVVTVLMFLAVAVASGTATKQGPSSLVVKFLAAGAYIVVLGAVVRPLLVPLGRRYRAAGRLTPDVFAVVLVVVLASAYVANQIGINVIVGGFLAGAVLPARQDLFRDMASRLADFTAVLLLPIFLAYAGLQTDFTKLGVASIGGILLFLGVGIASKWGGSTLFARLGGVAWGEGNAIGVLMNCRGLLVLVVGLIAANPLQPVISPVLEVGGVLMALVTTIMTGPLFDVFYRTLPASATSIAPVAPSGALYRVMAVLEDLDRAPGLVRAAALTSGERRPAELVMARLFPLALHDELPGGFGDEISELERSARSLRILSHFMPAGTTPTTVTYASSDPAADLARLAQQRNCDAIVAESYPNDGHLLGSLIGKTKCDVVVYSARGEGVAGGPVVVAGSSGAHVLAAQIAASLGGTVQDDGGEDVLGDGASGWTRLLSSSEGAAALVLSSAGLAPHANFADGRTKGTEAALRLRGVGDELLQRSSCPLFVLVEPGASQ